MKTDWKVGDYFIIDFESIAKSTKYTCFLNYFKVEQIIKFKNLKLKIYRLGGTHSVHISDEDIVKYKLPYRDYYLDQIKPAIIDDGLICRRIK